jgi:hypothetical protein
MKTKEAVDAPPCFLCELPITRIHFTNSPTETLHGRGQIADAVVRSPQPKIDVITGVDRGSSRRHMDQEFRASAKLLADSPLYARAVRG